MTRIDLSDDPVALLRQDLSAEQFVALGRGLGDSIDDLPQEWISGGEPRLGGSFQYSGGVVRIRRPGEAEFSPYTIADQYEDVRTHGGRVRLKVPREAGNVEVVLTVHEGRITQVMLVGSWLASLGCISESDLVKAFGATEFRARRHGWSTHFWPARGIAANCRDGGLFSIALGGVDPKGFTFSPVDLIRLALEWHSAPGVRGWPLVHAGGASQVAAQRLEALLQAFGVARTTKSLLKGPTWSPPNPLQSFLDGEFLDDVSDERMERISTFLADPSNGLPHQLDRNGTKERPHDLKCFWKRMISFRSALRTVTTFNSGVIMSGWGYSLLGVRLSGAIGSKLEGEVDALDKALAFLVDPAQQAHPWGRLVRQFGFPDEDYEALVADEY